MVYLSKARLSVSFLTCLLIGAGELAAAQDPFDFDLTASESSNLAWHVSGYVESRNQYFEDSNNWNSNRVAGYVEVKWEGEEKAGLQWRAYGSVISEYDEETRDYRDPARTEVKEVYLLRDGDQVDVTIGKQRVAWGTADGVSTIDRLNAVDFRDPIGNARTASRRPSWLVRTEAKLSSGILEMVWLPRGRDRKLPEYGSPWEPADLRALRNQERLGLISLDLEDPHKDEWGVRYSSYGEGIDWSVAYFNGYTDGGVDLKQVGNRLRFTPEHVETINVSGALGLTSSTLRAEVAYTTGLVVDGVTNDIWQVVLGWDRTFLANLYVNLQLFYDERTATPDDYGATFVVSNNAFDDAATYGLRGQVGKDGQLAIEGYFEFDVRDNLTLSTKYLVFDGEAGTALYDYRDNDFLELTLRWDF
ncbi:MAG: hypothetical protein AAF541_17305 [Pseudomonadota bacterium]